MSHHNLETLERFERYRTDPWAFLSECVYTQDQIDEENPVKLYPHDRDYLKYCVRVWQKHKRIANPKSRRMTMSWTWIALTLWDTIFHSGKKWALVSKKEDDSGELVERAEFIFNNIPEDKLPKSLLPRLVDGRMKKKPPHLEFNFGEGHAKSTITGYAMTADQLRQFTFSGILGDECAFWPNAEAFYKAAKPTTDGGGRMILVSSPAPGFFKKMVFDSLQETNDLTKQPEEQGIKVLHPMQGMRIWVNPKNTFLVLEIHYTADPLKRTEEFVTMLRNTNTKRAYMQEYELNWDSFAGEPVYEDFVRSLHISKGSLRWEPGLPLLIGVDFGHTPCAIIGQYYDQQLKLLKEFTSKATTVKKFLSTILPEMRILFPRHTDPKRHFFWAVDPAGISGNQNDGSSCVTEMWDAGIRSIYPGPVNWEERRSGVEDLLIKHTKTGPGILIDEGECPVIARGFGGGYEYSEKSAEIQQDSLRPIKNLYSHPHDGLQYLVSLIELLTTGRGRLEIPAPSYSNRTTDNNRSTVYGLR